MGTSGKGGKPLRTWGGGEGSEAVADGTGKERKRTDITMMMKEMKRGEKERGKEKKKSRFVDTIEEKRRNRRTKQQMVRDNDNNETNNTERTREIWDFSILGKGNHNTKGGRKSEDVMTRGCSKETGEEKRTEAR